MRAIALDDKMYMLKTMSPLKSRFSQLVKDFYYL